MYAEKITRRTQLAILSSGLLAFIGILVETSLNVAFPTLIKVLHVSLATVQWLTSGYLLMTTLVMSTTAFLLQKFQARHLFTVAISCFFMGTLLGLFTPNFGILLCGRLLQAISTGIATPLMFHIILETIPQDKLGIYNGIASMIISFAPALGPTYGGVMTSFLSWRMIFGFIIPILILLFVLGFYSIRIKTIYRHRQFDWLGLVLLAGIFVGFVEAFNQAGQHGFGSKAFITLLGLASAMTLLMIMHIRYGKRQLLNFAILKKPIVSLRALNFVILQFINIGVAFVIPVFSQNYLHVNAMTAGLIVLPGSILGAIVAPIAGRYYDQHGPKLPFLVANIAMMIGTGLMFLLTPQLTIMATALIYMCLRLGFNSGFGNTISDASKQVSLADKGDVNSLFNTLQQYAGSLGTVVLSALIAVSEMHHSNYHGYATMLGSHWAFLLLVVLTVIGLLTTIIINRLQKQN
ncbi:MAG: MFS transporter [Candidatus Paralactobacillus gallistercoris]|uniref:MFS transporter n=1 Tax=Candidatus Paralactobacillus gallistercoris TaxID=2838724 RepID=A0A948X0I4_9LACO|nr:MFS transporter [Candidatus Paralactobacillus gallistercoris]